MELYSCLDKLVRDNIPLLDVRTPGEFAAGAFPPAVNIPILTTEEHHLVGIKYREAGREAAIELGISLTAACKERRIAAWEDFFRNHPDGMIYCFRGGLRSAITQKWLSERGMLIPRIAGGYKALRQFLLQYLDRDSLDFRPYRLGGLTGVGKTAVLQKIDAKIDLERLANHRGSIFGGHIVPQPSQIDFENALAYELRQKSERFSYLIFEDEGKHIGKSYVPRIFERHLADSPLIVLEADLETRIDNIFAEYVLESQAEYREAYGSEYLIHWRDYIVGSINKARSRLGPERHGELILLVNKALNEQVEGVGEQGHKRWIERFLVEYYDPMYAYQLNKNRPQIIFSGNEMEVLNYIRDLGEMTK